MPGVTAWIDSLRESFGKEMVDQVIRTGLKEGTFWVVELLKESAGSGHLEKPIFPTTSPQKINRLRDRNGRKSRFFEVP